MVLPDGIANILSLYKVQKKRKVTYDSSVIAGLLCIGLRVRTVYLRPPRKGLFFSDVKRNVAHVMINTVDSNKNK